jgi:hypothetical protein
MAGILHYMLKLAWWTIANLVGNRGQLDLNKQDRDACG